MANPHQMLIRSLRRHSRLSSEDAEEIASLRPVIRQLQPNDDFVRQGDISHQSVLVLSGVVGRYHLLHGGRRQYLSLHMAGDLPDAQALFIEEMDHGLCAIGHAAIALLSHKSLIRAFARRPPLAFAVWRETLIDAAIFREAITNNSARAAVPRMAHLFCELFYRAQEAGLNDGASWGLPITLLQLGETLGMAIATVNRTLSALRNSEAVDFLDGRLTIANWTRLVAIGEFNPVYLHGRRLRPPHSVH
jgi:CRP-like cAMP-binding protein